MEDDKKREEEIEKIKKEIYKETLACGKCDSKNIYTNLKNGSRVCRRCGYKEIPVKDRKELVEGL